MLRHLPDLAVEIACHLATASLERSDVELGGMEARYRCPSDCSNPRASVLPIEQISVDENMSYPCYHCHRNFKAQEWLKGKVESAMEIVAGPRRSSH
ncbi:hypothetical protein K431DRAFT_289143 [Polychaeton citri CBS 116435]|uniref:Uncharacterized protein n=1 Tax=Polychaeton citri CBS 116435 TaxID=1314669 RepID=A0A9P4UKX0_9PEZI|nr:hypothetical protein K431DRAFT_289143 [Polychaeton citri CBS 116435]